MSFAAAPSKSAAPSESAAAVAPRVLYLLTAEISSVLVRGQLDWMNADGYDVHVGTRLSGGTDVHRWDATAKLHHIPFVRQISPLRDVTALAATIRLIRHLRPDIVNASTPKAGLLGLLAARACRVPVRIYVLRGLRFETTTGTARKLLIRLERLTERCSTSVLVNSPSARVAAEAAGIGQRRELGMIGAGSSNGVDTGHYSPATSDEQAAARASLGVPAHGRVIGFVGRLTNDKGIADVLHAFDAMRGSREGLHLLVVGDLEPGDPVGLDIQRQLAERHDVTLIPWVPDTAAIYPAIDVLAFASAREGLPNVPLQAQAAGVPVVAYSATGTVDALEHNVGGMLVPFGNRAALIEALADVVDDDNRRLSFGAAGPLWVAERFEQSRFWEQLGARYQAWLRQ